MQTFLPYPDFAASARCLDRQRLGKQRVEVLQILRALTGASSGWRNHPAVKMWRGHEAALAEYGLAICAEWTSRGYVDNCAARIADLAGDEPPTPPTWLGDERLHASHRSNLMRKNSDHYGGLGWTERDDLPYYWPAGRKNPQADVG